MLVNFVIILTDTEVNCQGMMYAIEFLMGVIAVACSSLLAARTVCVYTGTARTVVSVVVGVALLAQTATWMAGVPDVTAQWLPAAAAPWSTGACGFTAVASQYSAKYFVTVFVDALVLILTTVGVVRMGTSRIGEILVGQGIVYFVIVTVANLIVAILTVMQLSPLISLIGAVPSSAISIMAATRLYVYLAEAAAPQAGGVSSSQLSGSTVEKVSNFFRSGRGVGTTSALPPSYMQPLSYDSRSRGGSRSDEAPSTTKLPLTSSESMDSADIERAAATSPASSYPHNSVRVHQATQVSSTPIPDHLRGPPFLSEEQTARLENRAVQSSVHQAFPNLSARRPS